MAKTRKERRMGSAERKALAGIAAFAVVFVFFCMATVRAFALAAW